MPVTTGVLLPTLFHTRFNGNCEYVCRKHRCPVGSILGIEPLQRWCRTYTSRDALLLQRCTSIDSKLDLWSTTDAHGAWCGLARVVCCSDQRLRSACNPGGG